MSDEIISVERVSKRFAAVEALREVSLSLREGEIHGLCGENGAGKSTFVKLLMGILQPDGGSIRIGAHVGGIRGPRHAQRLGLGLVAQELSLAPRLSILDNIWLGSADVPLLHRRAALRERAQQALDTLGFGDWELDRSVGTLSIAQRQIVEIARLLARDARVLILDEPTATLTNAEIDRIAAVLRALRGEGRCVLYISHRLGEIFRLCDRVTVFRNGERVATGAVGELTRERLIELMLGRPFAAMYPAQPEHGSSGAVVVERLSVPGIVRDFSVVAARGKILCLAGQVGSGANLVTRALAGMVPAATGNVVVDGEPLRLGSVPRCVARQVFFLSEDRAAEGIFAQRPVLDNLVALSLARHRRGRVLNWRRLRRLGAGLAQRVAIDRGRLRARAVELSGGNQQKLLFARLLDRSAPGVLLMNEPTRGVDVGARADIYRLMRELCGLGYALIMTSADLEEVVGIADTVVTMYRGRTVGRYQRDAIAMAPILADIIHPAANGPTPAPGCPA